MDEADRTRIRGEHLANVCEYLAGVRLKWDASKGYSAVFAEQHDEVIRRIVEEPDRLVVVVTGLDDICNCGVCPNVRPACEAPGLLEKDQRLAREFGLELGREYRSADLIKTLSQKETPSG